MDKPSNNAKANRIANLTNIPNVLDLMVGFGFVVRQNCSWLVEEEEEDWKWFLLGRSAVLYVVWLLLVAVTEQPQEDIINEEKN